MILILNHKFLEPNGVNCTFTANFQSITTIWRTTAEKTEEISKRFFNSYQAAQKIANQVAKDKKVQLHHCLLSLQQVVILFLEEQVQYYLIHNPDDTAFSEKWIQAKRDFATYLCNPEENSKHPFFQFIAALQQKLEQVDLPQENLTQLLQEIIPKWAINPTLSCLPLLTLYEKNLIKNKFSAECTTLIPFRSVFQSIELLIKLWKLDSEWLIPYLEKELDVLSCEENWGLIENYKDTLRVDPDLPKRVLENANHLKSELNRFKDYFKKYLKIQNAKKDLTDSNFLRGLKVFYDAYILQCLAPLFSDFKETITSLEEAIKKPAGNVISHSADLASNVPEEEFLKTLLVYLDPRLVAIQTSDKKRIKIFQKSELAIILKSLQHRQKLCDLVDTFILHNATRLN